MRSDFLGMKTPIYFEEYFQPSSYKGLIEIVWVTMCENHPTHGKYLLHIDDPNRFKNFMPPFPTKWHLEFILLKRTDFYVRSFSPSLLRLPPDDIAEYIYSLQQQPADFDINAITLNDILVIHGKLSEFIKMLVNEERQDWEDFFKTHSETKEEKKDIIKDYSLATGIEINTLQGRFKRNPELKRVANSLSDRRF